MILTKLIINLKFILIIKILKILLVQIKSSCLKIHQHYCVSQTLKMNQPLVKYQEVESYSMAGCIYKDNG